MVKRTGCDVVKLEASASQIRLVREVSDAGVAVMAHIGLRPQAVGILGGFRFQGRTAAEAEEIVSLALRLEEAGAAGLLLEAVPPEVARVVVRRTKLPVIGCGAGPDCHGFVFVTQDAVGLSPHKPRFAPTLGDWAGPMRSSFEAYVGQVTGGAYPAAEHNYAMDPAERDRFLQRFES